MSNENGNSPGGTLLGGDSDFGEPVLAHNRLTIAGWAVAPDGIGSVEVRIAGRTLTAAYGLPTAEWALAGLPDWPDVENGRFELSLDTSRWDRGDHPFEVVATDRAGASVSLAGVADVQPFEDPPMTEAEVVEAIADGRPTVWSETPDLFLEHRGEIPLEVAGWATSAAGVESVLVTIDGRVRVKAVHGLVRPDLRSRFGDAAAADCGFAVRLDPAECALGWHTITVVAVGRDGRAVGVSGIAECVEQGSAKRNSSSVPEALPAADDSEEAIEDGRFVPYFHRRYSLEPEHYARYGWAVDLVEGLDVLDAGCGVGWGTALLSERAKSAVGMDLSPVAVAEAQRQFGQRADYRQGDLRRVPFDDGMFDVVVCFEAIEHVAEPELALDELRRVLRPGGLLLISSPNRGVYPDGNPFHLHEFTSREFQESLEARFANVAIHRQQTHFASLLGTEATLELDDPSVAIDAAVTKVTGGPPGSELYAVAVASDGALPPPPSLVVLGSGVDHDEQRKLVEMWQERAVRAEAEAAASRMETSFARRIQRLTREEAQAAADDAAVELARLERAVEQARVAAAGVEGSISWRATAPLRGVKRSVRRRGNGS